MESANACLEVEKVFYCVGCYEYRRNALSMPIELCKGIADTTRPIVFLKYIHDANIHTLLIQLSDFKFVALILCVLWISLFQTGCFLKPCRADCANQMFPICSQIWQSSVQGYKGRHIETIHRPIHHLSLLCFGFVFFISVLICVLKHFFNAQESL